MSKLIREIITDDNSSSEEYNTCDNDTLLESIAFSAIGTSLIKFVVFFRYIQSYKDPNSDLRPNFCLCLRRFGSLFALQLLLMQQLTVAIYDEEVKTCSIMNSPLLMLPPPSLSIATIRAQYPFVSLLLFIFLFVASTVAFYLYANKRFLLTSDFRTLYQQGLLIAYLKYYTFRNYTTAHIFSIYAKKYSNRPFLQYNNEIWTYKDVEIISNKIARWYKISNIGKNQSIALLLENCPEYFIFWIAAHKLGICCALINYNQTKIPLLHSLYVSKAHLLIIDEKNYPKIMSCYDNDPPFPIYVLDGSLHPDTLKNRKNILKNKVITPISNITRDSCSSIDEIDNTNNELIKTKNSMPIIHTINNELLTQELSSEPVPYEWSNGIGFHDPGLLVYTSGTTGLPKAANIPHSRIFGSGYLFASRFNMKDGDRLYNVLPFYHSSGGMLGFSLTLCVGGCMIVGKRFSASNFWHDCKLYNATVILYIGELCRYLLKTQKQDYIERNHNVRLAIGNGLGLDIWKEFQSRFCIRDVGEFYSSTEGNVGLFNLCRNINEQGAVGKMGIIIEWLSNMRLIRIDPDTLEPIRQRKKGDTTNNTGFCIQCNDGEHGELISKIITWDPIRRFSGYYNNTEGTQKKILTNVFCKGDRYFRTGDLLRKDKKKYGLWYFVDRLGDTFRWKGENVSTTEVQNIISQFNNGLKEYVVYGSSIPNHEGRACTLAIIIDPDIFNFTRFANFVQMHLPSYAIPLFLRIIESLDTTSTFKVKKNLLRDEGVNPNTITDPLYVYLEGSYVKLTKDIWFRIINTLCKL